MNPVRSGFDLLYTSHSRELDPRWCSVMFRDHVYFCSDTLGDYAGWVLLIKWSSGCCTTKGLWPPVEAARQVVQHTGCRFFIGFCGRLADCWDGLPGVSADGSLRTTTSFEVCQVTAAERRRVGQLRLYTRLTSDSSVVQPKIVNTKIWNRMTASVLHLSLSLFCSISVLRHIIFITSHRLHVIVMPTIFQAPNKL